MEQIVLHFEDLGRSLKMSLRKTPAHVHASVNVAFSDLLAWAETNHRLTLSRLNQSL